MAIPFPWLRSHVVCRARRRLLPCTRLQSIGLEAMLVQSLQPSSIARLRKENERFVFTRICGIRSPIAATRKSVSDDIAIRGIICAVAGLAARDVDSITCFAVRAFLHRNAVSCRLHSSTRGREMKHDKRLLKHEEQIEQLRKTLP